MSSILVPILIASFIGYQLDEVKLKKYEMVDETGETIKIQVTIEGICVLLEIKSIVKQLMMKRF